MKLISCDNCAVVLDADKLPFTPDSRKFKDDGCIDEDNFIYEGDDFVAFVNCPVCSKTITKE